MSANQKKTWFKAHILYYFILVAFISACSSSDDSNGPTPVASNPEFITKVSALSLNQITLYPGKIYDTADLRPGDELLASDVASGALVSIEVSFQIASGVSDYSLNAQLVPQSIYSQLNQGTTIGEIFTQAAASVKDENLIDLGSVYIKQIGTGEMRAIIQAKLPVLNKTSIYKIAIMPTISYLAAGKEFVDKDIEAMPVLLDDTEIIIKKLDKVTAEIVALPDLVTDNEFTELEVAAAFDKNGYSVEPIFQTSINVNLTTFNDQEVVVVKLNWIHPKTGAVYPLGLLSTEKGSTAPLISTEARFLANKQTDSTSMMVPVSAHAPRDLYAILLSLSTNIRKISKQTPISGNFSLNVATVDASNTVTAGTNYDLSLPLVSQDIRALETIATDYTKYSVLRAGPLNTSCIGMGIVIEGTPIPVDSITQIVARDCASLSDELRWRYDPVTQQFLFKIKDPNGDHYCLHVFFDFFGNRGVDLRKCAYETSAQIKPVLFQRFVFEDNKLSVGGVVYFVFNPANGIGSVDSTKSAGTDFFRDANGLDVDANGRVFSAGKSYDKSWGDADVAQVSLGFGGDSFVDYLPVIGATANGHAKLSASMLGQSADLINAKFEAKRYLDKKLSLATNNYPDKTVGDGMELIIDVAGKASIKLGSITSKKVTESYNPAFNTAGNLLNQIPVPFEIKPSSAELTYKMDQTFIDVTFVVVVVPVSIEGGVSGQLSFDVALTTTKGAGIVGLTVAAQESLSLNAYLLGKFDAVIVSGQLNANLELINQNVVFSTTHGFSANGVASINYYMDASLAAGLKVLKGELGGYVSYVVPTCCFPPWKTVKKDFTLFNTDYLYNKQWSIFSLNVPSTQLLL